MSPVAPLSVELEPAPEGALRKITEPDAQNEALHKREAELSVKLTKLRREITAFRNEVKRLLGHVPNSKHLIEEG